MTQDETLGESAPARPPDTPAADTPASDTSAIDSSGIDWDAVRDDFLYSGMAQRRIAWKYGMSDEKLRQRRRAEGWERVAPCVPLPTRRILPRDGEPPTPTLAPSSG
jgi:hypothetical protein